MIRSMSFLDKLSARISERAARSRVRELKRRAAGSGLADGFTQLCLSFVRNYPAWFVSDRNRSWVPPLVENAEKIDEGKHGVVRLTIESRTYVFDIEEDRSYALLPGADFYLRSRLSVDGQLVFETGASVTVGEGSDHLGPVSVQAFIQGPWEGNVMEMDRYMKRRSEKSLQESKARSSEEERKKFGA